MRTVSGQEDNKRSRGDVKVEKIGLDSNGDLIYLGITKQFNGTPLRAVYDFETEEMLIPSGQFLRKRIDGSPRMLLDKEGRPILLTGVGGRPAAFRIEGNQLTAIDYDNSLESNPFHLIPNTLDLIKESRHRGVLNFGSALVPVYDPSRLETLLIGAQLDDWDEDDLEGD